MNPAITGSDGIPQPADTAEAEQMGAFVEDAISEKEALESQEGYDHGSGPVF
jgi:hypothetical protein